MSALAYYLVAGSESTFAGVDLGDIQQGFVRKIQSYYPDNPIIWVSLEEVWKGLSDQVALVSLEFPEAFVVSLSSLYYPYACAEISVNRLVDRNGDCVGLGQRPRSGPLAYQVEMVMKQAGSRPIITVDDTLFHGDTLEYLMKTGLRIDGAVEFFTSKEALEQLRVKGLTIFTSHTLEGYIDVMPLHDFLPLLPLSGKVVGCKKGETCEPEKLEDGGSLSLPYLLPWVTPQQLKDWASIPTKYAVDFSTFALSQAIVAADRLRHHGFTTIREAISRSIPRRSIPCLNGRVPEPNLPVVEFLGRSLHQIGKQYEDEIS